MPTAKKKIMGQSVPDDEWVERVKEDIIEPELPIIDAHHHLWIRPGHHYLVPEFLQDLQSGHNVVGTIYAECHSMYRRDGPEEWRSLGETEFVTGCAAMADSGSFGDIAFCRGFIGNVDLMRGRACREIFERHLAVSGGRFKGIRLTTAWDADERIQNQVPHAHLLRNPSVRDGAGVMAEMGLTLDLWVYHPQLPEIAELADALPELTIVVNHTGVPILGGSYRQQHDKVFADWQEGIRAVAARPNTYMKLGAMPIRAHGDGVDRSLPPTSRETAAAWQPWMESCIEAFGVQRCFFESNFPVQKLFASYHVTWNAFKRLAAGASADEKGWLFHDAALAAYRV